MALADTPTGPLRRRPWRRRLSFGLALAATLCLSAGARAAPGSAYGPVKVPMMPGIREIARTIMMNLVRPHLADTHGDWLLAADLSSESIEGASNYATALSNGRLFVAVSPWADLAVFRWPHATDSDHLRYVTFSNSFLSLDPKPVRMGSDAPSADWARYGHPIEPCAGLGSSGGILSAKGPVLWTSEPLWASDRRFDPEDSTVLVTTLANADFSVEVSDWVDPDRDLMVRSFDIQGPAAAFFYHATFAPWEAAVGRYDESDPDDAGYGAIFLPEPRVMVHFQPKARDEDRPFDSCATAGDLDLVYPEGGVFVAYGFAEGTVEGFQVGSDRCVARPGAGGGNLPPAGMEDAEDGSLSGNGSLRGRVDSAISTSLEASGRKNATVVISVATTASGAVELIEYARAEGPSSLLRRARERWQGISQGIRVPDVGDPVTERVIHRSLLNLIQGQDKESGAIVASVSRQPHYHFDWPRDGAFFDLALDLAGLPAAVTRHHDFYRRTQYRQPIGFCPTWLVNYRSPWYRPLGHWPSNMAADGSQGSILEALPFEIDETGLLVWDFWRHEKVLAGASSAEASEYRARMRETLERAADALLDYVDKEKGWTLPAIEDDNFPPDATLHGVCSVLTGLAGACDAGPRWGVSVSKTKRWCEAAASLRNGVLGRLMDPELYDAAGWRGVAWMIWPAPVFDPGGDPRSGPVEARIAQSIQKKIDKRRPGFAYLGEEIFVLGAAESGRSRYKGLLERGLAMLTHEVPFKGTDCYGEVTLWAEVPDSPEKVAQQRTSIPHIWTGVTAYLAAVALYEPERLAGMRPPLPAGPEGGTP